MRLFFFVVALVAAGVITGCGDVPRSHIHGVVTYLGKPVSDATVIFIASDNRTYLAQLKADGSYEVSGVAQGPVKVSIQAALPKVEPRPQPPSGIGSKGGVGEAKDAMSRPTPPPSKEIASSNPLPKNYADAERSGLAFELKESDLEWSIDLK